MWNSCKSIGPHFTMMKHTHTMTHKMKTLPAIAILAGNLISIDSVVLHTPYDFFFFFFFSSDDVFDP